MDTTEVFNYAELKRFTGKNKEFQKEKGIDTFRNTYIRIIHQDSGSVGVASIRNRNRKEAMIEAFNNCVTTMRYLDWMESFLIDVIGEGRSIEDMLMDKSINQRKALADFVSSFIAEKNNY